MGMATASTHLMQAMMMVVMVVVAAVHAGAGRVEQDLIELKCCGERSCVFTSIFSENRGTGVLMIGQWRGCETEAEGWCFQDCQETDLEACLLGVAPEYDEADGWCSHMELIGPWSEISTSSAAVEAAAASLRMSSSPRKTAILETVIAFINGTATSA